jgi:primosomal protein N' (replication factor Y)
MIAKIALPTPLANLYDYKVPDLLTRSVVIGDRVVVPYNYRTMIGVIVDFVESSEFENLKEIIAQVDSQPIYNQELLNLTKWISSYYLCSWGAVLDSALPTGLKPKIKLILNLDKDSEHWKTLDPAQKIALEKVENLTATAIKRGTQSPLLKKQLREGRKKGYISYSCELTRIPQQSQQTEMISLNEREAGNLKTKKGSKADQLIQLFQITPTISKKSLIQQIANSSPVINKLIKKNVLSSQMVVKTELTEEKTIHQDKFLHLNQEQEKVYQEIKKALVLYRYRTFLLYGVTGSGKTEVYLHTVRDCLLQGRNILILIPEISLTPQTTQRFKERFGDQIAILHSGMGERERALEWWKIKEQLCPIVIGARSAVFAPLKNIGLIVVDEEHDSSYKQQESPHYNARDVAVKIAAEQNAIVILGSATPSILSFHNAQSGKYSLLVLKERVQQAQLPASYSINLKLEKRQQGAFYLSQKLITQLRENLLAKQQAIIFLNRRGFASFLSCAACEQPVLCLNCSIAMTWHKANKKLICHHCGYFTSYPQACPSCKNRGFRTEGIGTQRVEQDLSRLFPQARFLRMDRDSITKKGVLERNIDLINQREVDFIIGTQLISKGHDFQNIGVVAILLADMSLNIPDYRSSERSFQIFSQVSGRAGRSKEREGITFIQSYNINHHAIQNALSHNYRGFFEQEMEIRKILEHPPFTREIMIRMSDPNYGRVQEVAKTIGEILRQKSSENNYQVMGPIESFIPRVNNRFYWEILLKSREINLLKEILKNIFLRSSTQFKAKGVRISINVDP